MKVWNTVMTNALPSPVLSIKRGRGTSKGHSRASLRGLRQAKEVQECVGGRISFILERFRDEFAEIRDFDKAIKLLEKKGAVSVELFPYLPKRLNIIRETIAAQVADRSLKLDANKVPYLARDPEELHAQLVAEVAAHGMTSFKAQAIAHQREFARKAS
jgi:hypothetical protein